MGDAREPLRVFISYARSDAAVFAEELLHGLEVAGFEAFLDRHDIAAGEDWEARLGGLIQSADTVVFVLTPASAASERCAWEVERTEALSKRIIPVVAIEVPEADTPAGLRRLNYVFFTQGHSYSVSLGALSKALRVDLHWVREHTRLGELSHRWQAKSRADALLLRGPELDAARAWLAASKTDGIAVTELQRAFIAASEAAEGELVKRERRRRRALITALSAAVVVFAVLGGVAAIFGYVSDVNARLAREALAQSLIDRAWEVGDSQRDLALKYALAGSEVGRERQSLARAALAFSMERGESAAAVASGLTPPVRVVSISADGQTVALLADDGRLVFIDLDLRSAAPPINIGEARGAGFSPDGRRLFVVLVDNSGVVLDRASGARIGLGNIGSATRIMFSPDGRRLMLSGFGSTARLWNLESGRMIAALAHRGYVTATQFSGDGSRVLSASGDNSARIWDAATGRQLVAFRTDSYVIDAVFSADAQLVATSEGVRLDARSPGQQQVEASDGAIKVWNAQTGRAVQVIAHSDDVRRLAFSADGSGLFGLDEFGRFIQWDVGSGRPVKVFDGQRFGVTDGEFSQDGSIFVGRSETFAAVLWEANTNRVIGLLPARNAPTNRILGIHGNEVVLALADASVLTWDFSRALQPVSSLTSQACSILNQQDQLHFSEIELASDRLIAEAWLREDRPERMVCAPSSP